MSFATLPLYSTGPRSSEYHAVTTGTVNFSVTAFASANLMRGRRRHDRHTESSTLKLTLGEPRRAVGRVETETDARQRRGAQGRGDRPRRNVHGDRGHG